MGVARAHAGLWKHGVASLSQEGIKGSRRRESARTGGLGSPEKGVRGKGGREDVYRGSN